MTSQVKIHITLTSDDAKAAIEGLSITPNVGTSRTQEVKLTVASASKSCNQRRKNRLLYTDTISMNRVQVKQHTVHREWKQ